MAVVSFRRNANSLHGNGRSLIMYIDMNSYFASCEQQLQPHLRGKPIGVCPYEGTNAVVIAASREAKAMGIKTGMHASECKALCPDFIMVPTRPFYYRRIHVEIMNILRSYCDAKHVIPKSIDEAIVDLTHYTYVYKDVMALAQQIKEDIRTKIGTYITCSIGIAANVFYAKLATEIQKPDGLIHITPENVDGYLSHLKLTDIPGIGERSAQRLNRAGVYTTIALRNASESLLRKVFGGVVGNYWYYRLHFKEVDLYTSDYKHMSAMRSLSLKNRSSYEALRSMLISLCTWLEQRMVKQNVFCRELSFYAHYYNAPEWKVHIKLLQPLQDAMEMLQYIEHRISEYEKYGGLRVLRNDMMDMGVVVGNFIASDEVQYGLFDNKMQADRLRKVMYTIKDQYGKNMVRKASETIESGQMKDAIGFGSVKDLYQSIDDKMFNNFLLEEDKEMLG
jgi:Nucleotidyltransferase/DNA polymerase involved in DNA repair